MSRHPKFCELYSNFHPLRRIQQGCLKVVPLCQTTRRHVDVRYMVALLVCIEEDFGWNPGRSIEVQRLLEVFLSPFRNFWDCI
jgi:hypothetical protein